MSGIRSKQEGSRPLSSGVRYAAATFLCLLAPLLVFLLANDYFVLAIEIWPIYLALAAVGLVVGTIALADLTGVAKVAVWGFFVLAITFLYKVHAAGSVAVLAIVVGLVMWVLRHRLVTIVIFTAAIHSVSTLVLHNSDSSASTLTESDLPQAGDAPNLPPVLHLVLDELAGLRGLPEDLPQSRNMISRLAAQYPAMGFDLYSRAYSQYFDTNRSLANLLNLASSTNSTYFDGSEDAYSLRSNKYFEYLAGLGYELHIYQSSYMDFCSTPNIPIATCETYKSNSIGALQGVVIPRLEKSRFIATSYLDSNEFLRKLRAKYLEFGKMLGVSLPSWPSGNSRTGPLSVLSAVESLKVALREMREGEVHFAHLLIPHFPYNLDSDCMVRPQVSSWLNRAPFSVVDALEEQNNSASRIERYRLYLGQYECAHLMIDEILTVAKASGHWQSAVIIIHGDHGSRIVRRIPHASNLDTLLPEDFRDAYSTFFAVRKDDRLGRVDSRLIPLQALLGQVWQLPARITQPDHVFIRNRQDEPDLLAIPIQGFESSSAESATR